MPPRGDRRYEYSFESTDRLRDRERHTGRSGHPCARDGNCSAATVAVQDGETTRTPALAVGPWCGKDRTKAWRALTGLPELWVRLHIELGTKGQAGERVSGSRSAPVPVNTAVDALLREHIAILASWDERVRTAKQLVPADTQASRLRRDGRHLATLAATLAAHLDTLLSLPPAAMSRAYQLHDLGKIPEGCYGRSNRTGGYAEVSVDLSGTDGGEEILALHHRTRSMLGETRMRERLDVPCPDPSCDLLMLERVQGSDYSAECRACGRLLTDSEYHTWVRLYANSLSGAEIAARTTAA